MGIRIVIRGMCRRPPALSRCLIEAAMRLAAARLALRCVPFRRLAPGFVRPAASPAASYLRRRRIWEAKPCPDYTPGRDRIPEVERRWIGSVIAWLIHRAAARLPGQTTCFARAIAAQKILRRLGIATTLTYGAATQPDGRLATHVWLMDGETGVVGHDPAGTYKVLARYPAGPP